MFPLPRLSQLPYSCMYNVFEGLVCAALTNASKKTYVCAWTLWGLAESLAFAVINPVCKGDGQAYSFKIFIIVDTAVHFIAICALRRLGLIGNKGTALLATRCLLQLGLRIVILQQASAKPEEPEPEPKPRESYSGENPDSYDFNFRDFDDVNFDDFDHANY